MSDLGPISEACEASLAAAGLETRDNAAAALVRRYSALMDDAARLAAEADQLWAEIPPEDVTASRRLAKLEIQVQSQNVTSDLGPKLLAALTALGCTLAGRGAKGKDAPRAADPKRAAHDEIKARREARAHGTTALDATS